MLALENRIRANGENMKDLQIKEKILRTLTTWFEYVVIAIEELKDLSTMTVEELMSSLQTHEQRMIQKFEITIEEAL